MNPVIIIFGAAVRPDGAPSGAMRGRVEAALGCACGLEGVRFMPTGARGRHGRAEAEVMALLLEARGVPRSRIQPELTGTNTIRSVRACVRLLRGQPGTVYVATSAYHMPRCLALLRLAGLPVRACRAPPAPASGDRVKRWLWRLREIPALPVDSALIVWLRLVGRL